MSGLFQGPYCVPVPNTGKPGETPVLRQSSSLLEGELMSVTEEGIKTVRGLFDFALTQHAQLPYLGSRVVNPDQTLGAYEFKTYHEVISTARRVSCIMNKLGISKPNSEGLRLFTSWCRNCYYERLIQIACAYQNIVSCPMFDATSCESAQVIFEETQCSSVGTFKNNLQKVIQIKNAAGANLNNLEWVILFESQVEEQDKENCQKAGLKIITFDEILNVQLDGPEQYAPEPAQDDLIFLCYTSGTTGDPKGGMISNKNQLAALIAYQNTPQFKQITGVDKYLSFLPHAHVFEQLLFLGSTYAGASLGFFCGQIPLIAQDLAFLQPTSFISVPRVYNRFYDVIQMKINQLPPEKQAVVRQALKEKEEIYKATGNCVSEKWDPIVFADFKKILGGNVRFLLTGAAPISSDVKAFFPLVMSVPFYEGFGQTENTAPALHTRESDPTLGHTGGPFHNIELKIIDVPEMNYFVTDKDEQGRHMPRGELLTRGPAIFLGYYKKPQQTAETKDSEGWVHTGDIVALLPDLKAIKIIDRRKNIFKLAQGEYIAPEKIEVIYNLSNYIAMNFVYGDSLKAYLVGIVVPDADFVCKIWAPKVNLGNKSFEELCQTQELKLVIMNEIQQLAKEHKLTQLEIVKDIFLSSEPFSVENDLLTPTLKMKRNQAKIKYLEQLNKLYEGS